MLAPISGVERPASVTIYQSRVAVDAHVLGSKTRFKIVDEFLESELLVFGEGEPGDLLEAIEDEIVGAFILFDVPRRHLYLWSAHPTSSSIAAIQAFRPNVTNRYSLPSVVDTAIEFGKSGTRFRNRVQHFRAPTTLVSGMIVIPVWMLNACDSKTRRWFVR